MKRAKFPCPVSFSCRELQMKASVLVLFVVLNAVPANAEDPQPGSSRDVETAKVELRLSEGEAKVVTVSPGQSAREVVNLCRPAKVYADDDPWLIYPAAGGGYYVFMFSAEGTSKQMQGRLDPSRDRLYAVVRYRTDARENGKFLIPTTMDGRNCSEFVTLKVPLSPDKARVATAVCGMTADDVMKLFRPARDHIEKDDLVLLDAIHENGRYLLVFSSGDDNTTHEPKANTLSEVAYWPGGQRESIFLLPRKKRGEPAPAKYRAILEDSKSNKGTDQ